LADVGKDDVVYDLGSGDGRVVIAAVRDRAARGAVGIEIDPQRFHISQENVRQAGVASRVEVVQGDFFTNDFSRASVVTLYVGRRANVELRPKLFRFLKPGTRIVSHQYGMGEWPADKFLRLRLPHLGMYGTVYNSFANNPNVPEYDGAENLRLFDTISMWVVPAPLAGVWRGKVFIAAGECELKLVLHQRLSTITGSFELRGATNVNGVLESDLWGDHLRFQLRLPGPYGRFEMMFDGHVRADSLKGTLATWEQGRWQEHPWEGRRTKGDFTGTWEWSGTTGGRPVQLRIEQRNGNWIGTYSDPGWNSTSLDPDWNSDMPENLETSVSDFYDFGGGFYFTFLIGRKKNPMGKGYSLLPDDNAGWLIGEGIVNSGAIEGTISFYPCREKPLGNTTVQNGSQAWRPKRLTP